MDKQYPFVSVITVNYNGRAFLKDCFRSLYALDYLRDRMEIIMVDNGSIDGSVEYVRDEFPAVKILQNDVNNYCRANNLGIRASKGAYVAVLNNDVKVDKGWLKHLIKFAQSDPAVGAAGSRILLMDGTTESIGHEELPGFHWIDMTAAGSGASDDPQEVKSLSGCAVLYLKSALEEAGGFDEDFNMYMEDVDISLRMLKKKWKLFCVPKSLVYHVHHGTAKEDLALFYTERNRLMLIAKYYPEKLCGSLFGEGFFTVQRGLAAQGAIYPVLADLVAKLVKHHDISVVRNVTEQLFKEIKKIENHENGILTEKINGLLKTIESMDSIIQSRDSDLIKLNEEIAKRDEALGKKDGHIQGLNEEIAKRDEALEKKDAHINGLNQGIANRDAELKEKDAHLTGLLKAHSDRMARMNAELAVKTGEINAFYNSTAFRFLVRPLWAGLWKIKQALRIASGPAARTYVSLPAQESSESRSSCIAICTIISKNYLSYARVLTESFLEHNRGQVFVLLTDRVDGYFDPAKEKFTLIELETIKDRIPEFDRFCFQYNPTELNTAVKPFFLEFLFETYRLKDIIFLDPDILVTGDFSELSDLLGGYSIVLIPHITQPYPDTRKPSEIDILRSGVYNLGFIALAGSQTTKILLSWWKERLRRYCVSDIEKGLFVDQKWIDLVPGFFEDVYILRDKAYNIAYWNFHYRKVFMNMGIPYVDGVRARFIHFSGCNPDDLKIVSKHQDRFRLADLEHMADIFRLYADKIKAHGYDATNQWPCVYDYFDNGVRVPDLVRKLYWNMGDESRQFGDPSKTAGKSFFHWLQEPLDSREPVLTRFMHEVYNKRSDLQIAFPDLFGLDRKNFAAWFLLSAAREYMLDDLFLDKTRLLSGSPSQRRYVRLRISLFHKVRSIVKKILKFIYKDNLEAINNLRNIELRLYRTIQNPRRFPSGKAGSRDPKVSGPCGVNIFGYLTAESGVGQAARASTRCLEIAGASVSRINIEDHISRKGDLSLASKLSTDNPYPVNLIHVNADMFSKFIVAKGSGSFSNKYNIGYWTWELSVFPDQWRESFSYCDEIWTPSTFAYEAISAKSPVPVQIMPYAVEVREIKKVGRDHFALQQDEFVFLFMFDFFSYFERKNPLAVIRAFRQAFSPRDQVRLVIKCTNSSFDPGSLAKIRRESEGLRVNILDTYQHRDEVNTLLSHCDVYVSLHRSEGYGLTMAEAMYLGKPVIATNYSGNLDFMNIRNSYLVNCQITEIARDEGPYAKGNVWAEPDIGHAAELMRYVYKNHAKARATGDIAASDIREFLSYSKIGNEMKNRIDRIATQR